MQFFQKYNKKEISHGIHSDPKNENLKSSIHDFFEQEVSAHKTETFGIDFRIPFIVKLFLISSLAVLVMIIVFLFYASPPDAFPISKIFVIEQNGTISDMAVSLEGQEYIRSSDLFLLYARLTGVDTKIVAGQYAFSNRLSLPGLVQKFVQGEYGDVLKQIVVYEGETLEDMAQEFERYLEEFSGEKFLRLTEGKEGYLFPDTYTFFRSADETDVIDILSSNFDARITEFKDEIQASSHSLHEIITMASIIEREAAGDADRFIISGILWNRIANNMLLQVDATFVYSIGKGSAELTLRDLQTDGLYNTYTRKGLPPGPIGAPGRDAIEAALRPAETTYVFYLHDSSGTARYAETHDGHVQNKRRYLR